MASKQKRLLKQGICAWWLSNLLPDRLIGLFCNSRRSKEKATGTKRGRGARSSWRRSNRRRRIEGNAEAKIPKTHLPRQCDLHARWRWLHPSIRKETSAESKYQVGCGKPRASSPPIQWMQWYWTFYRCKLCAWSWTSQRKEVYATFNQIFLRE